jgi:hypothetical protein
MLRVKGEETRLKRRQVPATSRTTALRRVRLLFIWAKHDELAIARFEGLVDGLTNSPGLFRVRSEPIHNDLNYVDLIALELLNIFESHHDAIDTSAHKAPATKVLKSRPMVALPPSHDRGKQSQRLPRSLR